MKELLTAVFEITNSCNLRCHHCYMSFNDVVTVSYEDIQLVLNQLSTLGCKEIAFSGGEPLMAGKRFFRGINYARPRFDSIVVTTNATMLKEWPKSEFSPIDILQVSLDGPEVIHEQIRGPNTFAAAMEGLDYVMDYTGLLTVMMTISNFNYSSLPILYKIMNEAGIGVGIERVSGVRNLNQKTTISARNLKWALEYAVSNGLHCNDPLQILVPNNNRQRNPDYIAGCSAGVCAIAIDANLNVLPCVRLRVPLGNLRENSLEEILLRSLLLKIISNRDLLKDDCGECQLRQWCGGCRAAAYAEIGDVLGQDPQCWKDVDYLV